MGHFGWIMLAIVIGTIPGWLLAKRVKMTAMPQMVSLFNGMGGACAMFISLGEITKWEGAPEGQPSVLAVVAYAIPMLLGIVLGGNQLHRQPGGLRKIAGIDQRKAVALAMPEIDQCGRGRCASSSRPSPSAALQPGRRLGFSFLPRSALLLGVLQVLPIGGADMPVVISVLNSCTGLAAAVTGFAMTQHVHDYRRHAGRRGRVRC